MLAGELTWSIFYTYIQKLYRSHHKKAKPKIPMSSSRQSTLTNHFVKKKLNNLPFFFFAEYCIWHLSTGCATAYSSGRKHRLPGTCRVYITPGTMFCGIHIQHVMDS